MKIFHLNSVGLVHRRKAGLIIQPFQFGKASENIQTNLVQN